MNIIQIKLHIFREKNKYKLGLFLIKHKSILFIISLEIVQHALLDNVICTDGWKYINMSQIYLIWKIIRFNRVIKYKRLYCESPIIKSNQLNESRHRYLCMFILSNLLSNWFKLKTDVEIWREDSRNFKSSI